MVGVFRTVSKRRNSTKTGTGGTSVGLILKEGCSIIAPRIALKWDGSTAPTAWNHVFIEDWDRTYWIDNWTYEDRQWIADCSVDVLASYKTTIGNAEKYILRAADDYDEDIIDTLYPAKMSVKTATTIINNPYGQNLSGGVYIISLSGRGSTGVTYLQMTPANMTQLLVDCYQNSASIWNASVTEPDLGAALQTFGNNIYKSVLNPYQYINSVMWFPEAFSATPGGYVAIGNIVTSAACSVPSEAVHAKTYTLAIPTISVTEKWEKAAPYRRYELYIPPFGAIELDATLLVDATSINIDVEYDYISGGATATVYTVIGANTIELAKVSGQIGIPIATSSNSIDNIGALTAKTGAVRSIVNAAVTGNLGAVGGSILSAYSASIPGVQQHGVSGGVGYLKVNHYLRILQFDPPEFDIDERGRPLMKKDFIMLHSGYLLCADGDVEIAGTPGEAAQIAAYLTGGFFYE